MKTPSKTHILFNLLISVFNFLFMVSIFLWQVLLFRRHLKINRIYFRPISDPRNCIMELTNVVVRLSFLFLSLFFIAIYNAWVLVVKFCCFLPWLWLTVLSLKPPSCSSFETRMHTGTKLTFCIICSLLVEFIFIATYITQLYVIYRVWFFVVAHINIKIFLYLLYIYPNARHRHSYWLT